jgi:predicted naringenin-chalcone synthase
VSCTGFAAPGVDIDLIGSLGLRPTTERIHIGFMGCQAVMNALRCARAITLADPRASVLLCAVELCSLHYCFNWDSLRMVSNALFGDGAGAVVLSGASARLPAESSAWKVAATGSCVLPDSKDAMTWRIGDWGFEMSLAATVSDLIRRHLAGWLAEWLGGHGHTIDSIQSWAIHPGGPRILNAAREALSLPAQSTTVSDGVLAEFGNMSSPTVLFILDRLRQRHAALPCVSLGFGPGLSAEAALFD